MAKSLLRETDSSEVRDVLQRVSLSDQVKEYVINAILSGELAPGQRVVESALARRLGVSQAPVRDALRELVVMGFLEMEPFKGTSVRRFTREDLYEVYTVRAALESLAARTACQRATEADLETLRGILAEMVQAGRDHDVSKMTELDNAFHETILGLSGNKLLYQLWQRLRFGYWTIVTARMGDFELEELARRHEELYKALASRKPSVAAAAMRRHIEELGKPPEGIELEGKEE